MKYKVKQYILRAAPLILVCCIFVFALSPSASAATVSYWDLNPEIVVDGDNNLISIMIPSEYITVSIKNTSYETLASDYGFVEYDVSGNLQYRVDVQFFAEIYLDITSIPNDTTFAYTVEQYQESQFFTSGKFNTEEFYYNSSGDLVNYKSSSVSNMSYDGRFTFASSLDKSNSATAFRFGGYYSFKYPNSSGLWLFSVVDATIQFSVSSFLASQQGSAQTNKLLDEVNRQLADQGKTMEEFLDQQNQTNEKLDNIINGEVAPEAPEGADKVGDLDDAEAQLRDEAQVGLDQGVEIQQSVLQILEEYANGFAVFSWIFGLFAKLPFFSGLLYVSVALGTVSALLNLGLSAQAASNRANSRAQRDKKGG